MAAEFKIGRLRFSWKGQWTPATVYARDDVASYQGKTYVCLLPNTSDNSSFYNDLYKVTNGAQTPYWNLVVDGKSFVSTNNGNWQTGQFYSLGNLVIFGGIVYYCNTQHTSTAFSSQSSYWTIYTEFAAWRSAGWLPNYAYGINDVVKYGGIVYECIANHTSAATTTLGLEANQSSWTILRSGIEYKGQWSGSSVRYKTNDLVKNGPDLWLSLSGHTSTSTFDQSKWAKWMPGIEYAGNWSSGTIYQPGDSVEYGGYVYVNNTANNVGNIPSTDAVDWTLLNTGYEWRGEYSSGTFKIGDVVRRHGVLYVATADSSSQDPSAYSVATTYTAAGSSGTTLVVASTSGVSVGMNIISAGFTSGQAVVSVTNSTTLVISAGPDGVVTDGQAISFVGVNYLYWKILVTGTYWTKTWALGQSYTVGDIAVWQNGTYVCVQNNTGTYTLSPTPQSPSTRPDTDTTNTYWVFYVPHARKNALTTFGDIETYNNNSYYAIPIGSTQLVLRNTNNLPTWSKINAVSAVYYVSNTTGTDRADYGTTWDQPWKTINYACNFIGAGTLYPNSTLAITTNKTWITTELVQWVIYQKANNLNGFSSSYSFDQTKTVRDAGYIIDAIVYDLARGGNSQTVAATLAYFQFNSTNQFYSTAVAADVPYYIPILNQLLSLIINAVQGSGSNTYQNLNNVSPQIVYTAPTGTEINSVNAINSLYSILTTALTTASTLAVPTPNSGITASIFVKTGTYAESLPIVVPENTAIIGDELRGVVVSPLVVITTNCTATSGTTKLFTVASTTGLINQMPVQFVDPSIYTTITYSTFGGVTAGQTYYVVGSSITPTQFSVTGCTGTYTNLTATTVSATGSGATFSVSATNAGAYNVTLIYGGAGYTPNDTIKILGTQIGGSSPANDINIIATGISGVLATGPMITFTKSGTAITQIVDGVGFVSQGTHMLVYAGDCIKDMFRLRNGSGLRNMTFTGLLGTLGALDANQIQRPTGGSYACLDPGLGPNDTSAWIFRRSPYVQNVTAFGNGATGLKIDGTLHNGGNKSIVCNDFTHILSDGIGIWCTGPGALTEAVSVFSYYGYCGYFAENGGRIRATNGNTSYGQFGVIASGYDVTEVPATGIIYNQSSQVQATVQSAFGSNSQLLRLNYSNAGSNYYTPTTNLLNYSNNFTGSSWSVDNVNNINLTKTVVAPTGITEAWTITGLTTGAGTNYVYQNISIPSAGTTYTNISGVNISGSGTGCTFNVTVTSTAYVVTVANGGGSGYVTSNQIYIAGGQLGGVNSVNDCIITVTSLAGSAILGVTNTGTVPTNSALNYTLSVFVKQGSSPTVDLYGIFSGSNTVTSSISYNFLTNTITASNSGGGLLPTQYGAINQQLSTTSPTAGWYRLWFTINDTTGLNTQLQFRIYPKGYNGAANQYTYFYGSQTELSKSTYTPSFYLEVATTTRFTAYANYNISGAGTGVVTVGDEIRSNSIFQTRITTDSNGITGGAGYLTASNNAQAGTTTYIQLAQSDTNTNGNYTGMRVFVNSGTGAGQFGYISYYNTASKLAYVLKESFLPIKIKSTAQSGSLFTTDTGNTTTSLYIGQPVQFIPTYYTTAITSTSLSQTTVLASTGGTTNTFTITSTLGLQVNTGVSFVTTGIGGTTFGGVTTGYTYYIYAIIDSQTIQISSQIYGTLLQLNTYSGTNSMVMNFSSNNSYLQGTTTNMIVNYPIQFTGTALGGLSVGTVYYISDVIDIGNFTISGNLASVTVTGTTATTNTLTVASTSSLVPLNPIIFSAPVTGNIVDGTKYYISQIIDSQNFTVASSLISVLATATQIGTNLITVSSTTGFQANQPIQFVGITFGNIISETIYYILAINNATTFTISQSPGGGAVPLQTASGSMTVRTCPASFALTTTTGQTMPGVSTAKKTSLSLGTGTMNGTFSTQLFGNVQLGYTYYVNTIVSSTTFTITATSGSGSPVALVDKTGSMNIAAVGWDHVNIGTPIAPALDSSSVYYIEPKTTFDAPPFVQTAATTTVSLTGGTVWQAMAYGDGYWVALPSTGTTAARSTDGIIWNTIALPSSLNWTGIAYGNGYWVAISSAVTGTSVAAVSKSAGYGWRTFNMPSTDVWSNIVYGNGRFVAIATGTTKVAYSTNFGSSWSAATLPNTANWTGMTYGNGTYVAISSGGNTLSVAGASGNGTTVTLTYTSQSSNPYTIGQKIVVSGCSVAAYNGTWTVTAVSTTSVSFLSTTTTGGNTGGTIVGNSLVVYSTNATTWLATALPDNTAWTSIAYGSGQFVAVSSTSHTSAYSVDGITWFSSNLAISANSVTYGQGVFLALTSSSTVAYTSEGGTDWQQQTVTGDAYSAVAFGYTSSTYNGLFVTLAGPGTGSKVSAGCKTKGRPVVTSGVITAINEWEPGSGYNASVTLPAVAFTDPNVTTLATTVTRVSNGVLSNPTFNNRGSGYNNNSTVVIITGNGFADQYQTGLTIILNNLTRLPSPGDNLTITGVNQIYKVTSAYSVFNTAIPNLEANVSISPSMSTANSTANGTVVSIRSKYSQARLTGHDFLNIGYGDFIASNYPGYPLGGYVASSQNQTVETNYGRVFYTSTDQDGNFKVGNLFGVQQATGIVTLSASQFGLTGLSTLSLGGISVGGSSVVITQFSTDQAFTANSDQVIPTQRAIKAYLTSRLSQGGSNTYTGQLTAGTVVVGGPNTIRSSIPNGINGSVVKMTSKVNVAVVPGSGYNSQVGVDGAMQAWDFFKRSWTRRAG